MSGQVHIIFDLDGTLIDSRPEIQATYRRVFTQIAPTRPIDLDTINYGLTLAAILDQIYGPDAEKIAAARAAFTAIYDSSDYHDTKLYSGVAELLPQLKEAGYTLHIATNKRLVSTRRILQLKQMENLFTGVITSDSGKGGVVSKADMVAQLCATYTIQNGYMVGDADTDIEAGRLSGLDTVAALYGYEKKEVLSEKNPKFVIHQFTELGTIFLPQISL